MDCLTRCLTRCYKCCCCKCCCCKKKTKFEEIKAPQAPLQPKIDEENVVSHLSSMESPILVSHKPETEEIKTEQVPIPVERSSQKKHHYCPELSESCFIE